MKKVLVLTISSLFLMACGSGESTTESTTESNIGKPSLSEISGVWDLTETDEFGEDQLYVAIKESGEFVIYDYDGDSWDQGEDCYYKFSETITDLGNGSFEISEYGGEYSISNISLSENQLTVTESSETLSFPKSSLQESDFVPLCDEVTTNPSTLRRSISEKQYLFINRK